MITLACSLQQRVSLVETRGERQRLAGLDLAGDVVNIAAGDEPLKGGHGRRDGAMDGRIV